MSEMDRMVKIGKYIIGAFGVLIVIGLFMPSSPDTAPKAQASEVVSGNKDAEDKLFSYMLKFEKSDTNLYQLKEDMISGAYEYCKDLNNGKASYVKSDPYFLLGSLEISPRWTARTTGAVMYLCPEHLDGLDKFLDTVTEDSVKAYLVESYPNDEMYTNADRQEFFDIIIKNLTFIGSLK